MTVHRIGRFTQSREVRRNWHGCVASRAGTEEAGLVDQASPLHRPAARVLRLDPAGRVLRLRWRAPAERTTYWEAPAGGLEPGESPIDAARRWLLAVSDL